MTDADWLWAVAASPDDPLVRLAYADFLDDRDDPRAEQLRLDVELARLGDADPVASALRARLAELIPGTDARWRAAVCRVPVEAGEPFAHPRRHPLNAPGPWYTCGDCMACEAPEHEAPDLLAPLRDGNSTTHFIRQPRTAFEVRRACEAARVCCMEDVRYGGTDPVVIQMLGNDPVYCDHLIPATGPAVERVDPPPDPRGVAYVAAAYEGYGAAGRVRRIDRVIDRICLYTLIGLAAGSGLILILWMLVGLLQLTGIARG